MTVFLTWLPNVDRHATLPSIETECSLLAESSIISPSSLSSCAMKLILQSRLAMHPVIADEWPESALVDYGSEIELGSETERPH